MRLCVCILLLASCAPVAQEKATGPAVFGKPVGSFFALSVGDIQATTKWYEDKLGFRVLKTGTAWGDKVRFALLGADGAVIEIIQHKNAKPLSAVAPDITESFQLHGIFKMGVIVADLDETYRRVKERGVPIAYEIMPARDIPYRSFSIRDNEKNLVQFFGK